MTVLRRADSRKLLLGTLVLLLVAGLYMVKWKPYLHKAIEAAGPHSLAEPIVGWNTEVPEPSPGAALGYAGVYFLAVWKAMVLGLLIGRCLEGRGGGAP